VPAPTAPDRRDVATLFLLNRSTSTRGWPNRIGRETLVLLCDALDLLGDRYGIYGFSGPGDARCIPDPVRSFTEAYSEPVWQRIGDMKPQQYTHGIAIRHHSAKLLAVEARTRLLVILSDGRQDNQEGHHGTYSIEDTRKALIESHQKGIHPFCITIRR